MRLLLHQQQLCSSLLKNVKSHLPHKSYNISTFRIKRQLSSLPNTSFSEKNRRLLPCQHRYSAPFTTWYRCQSVHCCNHISMSKDYAVTLNRSPLKLMTLDSCSCSVSLRYYASSTDNSSDPPQNEDRSSQSTETQGNISNSMDDIGTHPEVKEIMKDIMKDFKDEYGFEAEELDKTDGCPNKINESTKSLDSGQQGSNAESSSSDSESDEEVSENLQKALNIQEWEVIDVDKEMSKYNIEEFYGIEYTEEEDEDVTLPSREELLPISVKRGVTGVFDVEELVTVLKDDNLQDVCVIRVSEDIQFVDYMVLVSGKSSRQLKAAAENIQWIWKRKRGKKDPPAVKVEGLGSGDWLAMDMGNIALHLFLPEVRAEYDLETLWACGPEFDEKNADGRETYSIPVSTGFSMDESRHALISNIDQQIRRNREGVQGHTGTEAQGHGKTWRNYEGGKLYQVDQEEFIVSKDMFTKDLPENRVQRKYIDRNTSEQTDEMSFENTSGYHTKYQGSDPN